MNSFLFQGRRVVQSGVFLLFLFLFIQTDYKGEDQLSYAVNIFFRLDPFLFLVTLFAEKSVIHLMLPALGVVVITFFVGRAFCGWFCPMGSMLDAIGRFFQHHRMGNQVIFPGLARYILVMLLIMAFFNFHIAGFFDPFSILVRGLVQALYPALHAAIDTFFSGTYAYTPESLLEFTDNLYYFLNEFVLPAEQRFFELAYLSLCILLVILFLERLQKRFFCRYLCPVGALLGVISGSGLVKVVQKNGRHACGKCSKCEQKCRMGAIKGKNVDMSACTLCMECMVLCPQKKLNLTFARQKREALTETRGVSKRGLSRRQLLSAIILGVIIPGVKKVEGHRKYTDQLLIRPPGALAEKNFLARCVRCAECIQVCIGNGLQPVLFEGGVDALFSPKLVARTGYCEFNCTLCGQVCPTGAIENLSLKEKHSWKIGNAWFDKNLCLPYARNISCIVCEEHCPTPEKAIQFKEVEVTKGDEFITLKQPYVIDELCIGCGICELKCPLPGKAAIYVTSGGEQRNPLNAIPKENLQQSPY